MNCSNERQFIPLKSPACVVYCVPCRRQPATAGTAAPADSGSGGAGQSGPGSRWPVAGSPADDRPSPPGSAGRRGAGQPEPRWRLAGGGGRRRGSLSGTAVTPAPCQSGSERQKSELLVICHTCLNILHTILLFINIHSYFVER